MAKTFFCACAAVSAVLAANALDNTVSDSFWDTTGYVNGETSVASAAIQTEFDSRTECACASAALGYFSSSQPGLLLTIR